MPQTTLSARQPTARLDNRLQCDLGSAFFQALCDPTRLALLARLAGAASPMTVTEASECCGVHLSGVSRHLKTLRDAGLVQSERVGREVRYRLDCASVIGRLRSLADTFEACHESCCGASLSTESDTTDTDTTDTETPEMELRS